MTIVFDSYAWIEYFAGSPKGKRAEELLKTADITYTPAVCLTEIKNRFYRAEFSQVRVEQFISFIRRRSTIISIDEEMAIDAAENMKKFKLHAMDAIIYACANKTNARLVTGDAHFKNIPNIEFLG